MKKKAHIRYRLKDNTLIPGVSTIKGQLGWNTNVLCNWNNKMGLQGIDTKNYVSDTAQIGTLGHQMAVDWLLGKETNTDDYSKNQIKAAENSARSFFKWATNKKIKPILIEQPLVSEDHLYGGTPDIYAEIDGTLELIDLKTGSGIYDDMVIQVAGGYRTLLIENGHPIENVRILNIPRTGGESFIEKSISLDMCLTAWSIFQHCLEIYMLRKEMKG